MHRIFRSLLRDYQLAKSLLAKDARQPLAVQHCTANPRLLPDPDVSLASRSFASGSDNDDTPEQSGEQAESSAEQETGAIAAESAEVGEPSLDSPEDASNEAAEAANPDRGGGAALLEQEHNQRTASGLDFHIGEYISDQFHLEHLQLFDHPAARRMHATTPCTHRLRESTRAWRNGLQLGQQISSH